MTPKEKHDAMRARLAALYKAEPQAMGAFRSLAEAAMRPGRLTPAVKELAAVAMAVGLRCEDCIVFHVAAARKHGATREELGEILAVAVDMAGGPGAVYAARALEIWDGLG